MQLQRVVYQVLVLRVVYCINSVEPVRGENVLSALEPHI